MIGRADFRIECAADRSTVSTLRHALDAFLAVFALERDVLEDILMAVGEALANAVEHSGSSPKTHVVLAASMSGFQALGVDVYNSGDFVERPSQRDRGFGLRIIRSIANDVTIENDGGTHVRMLFDPWRHSPFPKSSSLS